jgi:hypothetical protein
MWTALPSADYYALSATSWGIGVSLGSTLPTSHSPSHPSGSFPCSVCRTQAERCRWRVADCPFRSLRLPSRPQGRSGLPVVSGPVRLGFTVPTLLSSSTMMISVDWLTSQTRSVRVWVTRRAMRASGDSPWRSSAKHHLLRACLPLMAPFRAMLLTPWSGPWSLGPRAQQVPVHLLVFSTFLHTAFTAHPYRPISTIRVAFHTKHCLLLPRLGRRATALRSVAS